MKPVNTNKMLASALRGGYAVPAFNFCNMETAGAIAAAAAATNSPVILSVSASALKYMGDFLIRELPIPDYALHLDHGASFEICAHAIELGFSSVMIDGSALAFDDNVALTKQVVEYAHARGISVEGELGVLSGIEDDVAAAKNIYTNPVDAARFAELTGVDSLAIAIGTSHGAYKRKSDDEQLRFDILEQIAGLLPDLPLVLHGASTVPRGLVDVINGNGGRIENARGIDPAQIRRAVGMNVCKVNVDSDARLAFTAAVRKSLSDNPENFDPRKYLGAARDLMTQVYIDEIREIMGSENKMKNE